MHLLNGKKNKKGQNLAVEGITILVVLVIFAIAGLYAYSVFDELNTDIQANDDIHTIAKTDVGNLAGHFPAWYDGTFLFVFVLFVLFVLVSAFMMDEHPIMFAVSIILLLAFFTACILMGNAYDDIASDSEISEYSNNLTYMGWVMRNILPVMIGVFFLVGIVTFIKFKAG